MAYRSVSTNNVEATNLVITAPSGIVDGDILIAFAHSDDLTATVTCSGFTAVTGTPITTTTDSARTCVLWKKAASESGNYTLASSAGAIIGGIIVFSGRDPTNFLHRTSVANQNTGDPTPTTMVSTAFSSNTTEECDILMVGTMDCDVTSTDVAYTPPSGYTQRVDIQDTADGLSNIGVATLDAVAAGATGALTMIGTQTGGTSGWAAVAIALMKAAPTEFNGRWQLEDGSGNWQLEDGSGYWVGETFVAGGSLAAMRRDRNIVPLF